MVTGLSVLPKISARNLDLKLNTVVNIKNTANPLIINYPASFLSLANSVLVDNRDGVNAVTVQINRQLNTITIAAGNFRAFNDAWIEQINLTEAQVHEVIEFLMENTNTTIAFNGDDPIEVRIPQHVNIQVQQTEPGEKGNTAQGGSKRAILETAALSLCGHMPWTHSCRAVAPLA